MNTNASLSDAERQRLVGVEPPCIAKCSINPETQICGGCYRHMDEIITWSMMTPREREEAMAQIEQRRQAANG